MGIVYGLGSASDSPTFDMWGQVPDDQADSFSTDTSNNTTANDPRYAAYAAARAAQAAAPDTPQKLSLWQWLQAKFQTAEADLAKAHGSSNQSLYLLGGAAVIVAVVLLSPTDYGTYDPDDEEDYHNAREQYRAARKARRRARR